MKHLTLADYAFFVPLAFAFAFMLWVLWKVTSEMKR